MALKVKNVNTKTIIAFALFIVLLLFSQVIPLPKDLSREGLASICLLVGTIILWITEAMPLVMSTFLAIVLMPYFGILDVSLIWSNLANSVFFFILATFALTGALAASNIPNRIANIMLKWAGVNSTKLVFGFVLCTAILSSIMSNVPTCALFMSLSISIIKANGNPLPGTSNLGRALMIGVPAGAVLGGFMTIAGGPINIMVVSFLEEYVQVRVTFLDWMVAGIPVGLLGVAVCSIWITTVFKPEPISLEAIEFARAKVSEAGPLSVKEKKILIIVAMMFTLWILSTWIPILNTTLVALMGMVAFFLPKVEVLTWKEFEQSANWEVLFMIGGVNALAAGILNTGAASWLVNSVLADAAVWPPLLTIIMVSAICAFLHILIPSGPAVVGLATIPMIEVAILAGLNPVSLAMITAFWGACTFMLPIDAIFLLTYGEGYYKMTDVVKSGWVPTIVMTLVVALLIPPIISVLGY